MNITHITCMFTATLDKMQLRQTWTKRNHTLHGVCCFFPMFTCILGTFKSIFFYFKAKLQLVRLDFSPELRYQR